MSDPGKIKFLRLLVHLRRQARQHQMNGPVLQEIGKALVEIADRETAAQINSEAYNSIAWKAATEGVPVGNVLLYYDRLLDPAARKGRPKGSGQLMADTDLLSEIDQRVRASGLRATTVARQLLAERGVSLANPEQIKHRVDRIVKLYRKRGKN